MQPAPEEQIGFLLKRLQQALRNLLETRLRQRRTDVSLAHLVTLDLLDGQPALSGAQLARRLAVTAQTMNQMLQRLEAAGEIERRPHPENRRADRWFLTVEGKRQLQGVRTVARPVMTHMLSRLQPHEITRFRHFLEVCASTLESAPAPARRSSTRAARKASPRRGPAMGR